MTRHRTVRPLIAAWIFVFAILVTGFIWLSLSPDVVPVPDENLEIATQVDDADTEHNIAIASDIPPPETKHPDTKILEETLHDETPELDPEPEDDNIVTGISLAKAPIEGLVMMGANGPLPVLGPDSMVAWKEYARPDSNTSDDRPKVAILITGIGLNSKSSDLAVKR